MNELSIQRRARIERVLVIRRAKLSRQREATAVQKSDGILVMFGLGIAFLILGIVFLVYAEWQPGNQAQIANEYRRLRHDAITVAQEEWK